MNPAGRALWYIESHLDRPLTVDAVADAAGVSPYHLSRVFSATFGVPLLRYVRVRRLGVAARALAGGAPDILAVALDAGYGSHEAFTRAFRETFGVTPDSVRAARSAQSLDIQEPFHMNEQPLAKLSPTRIVAHDAVRLVGLNETFDDVSSAGIPALWGRFAPLIPTIANRRSGDSFGVLHNGDGAGNVDYMCAVEVADFSDVPPGLARLTVPAQTYAVFAHAGHVSEIRKVWSAIFGDWLPNAEHRAAEGPELERYGQSFDPATGRGGFEIWIPLRPQ